MKGKAEETAAEMEGEQAQAEGDQGGGEHGFMLPPKEDEGERSAWREMVGLTAAYAEISRAGRNHQGKGCACRRARGLTCGGWRSYRERRRGSWSLGTSRRVSWW